MSIYIAHRRKNASNDPTKLWPTWRLNSTGLFLVNFVRCPCDVFGTIQAYCHLDQKIVTYLLTYLLKAAFHYSSPLQTWFSTTFAARFSTSSYCRKPGREPQQVRWVVYVLDKYGMQKKNRFKQVRSWLSTCLRPGFRLGLRLARIMERGLYLSACVPSCTCLRTRRRQYRLKHAVGHHTQLSN